MEQNTEHQNHIHFDEGNAILAVSKMFHYEEDILVKGEKWTIEQVRLLAEEYMDFINEVNTIWDIYVALHIWWHDLGRNYERRGEYYSMIEDAIVWSFMDEDAKEGKVWRYVRAVC